MKALPQKIVLTLAVLVSVLAVTGCTAITEQKPSGMTLEDAPAVLDLTTVLSPGFTKLDEWQAFGQGLSRENLGLGINASEPLAFRSDNPFQLVYCFVRIIEDVTEQSNTARNMFDENTIRDITTTFLDLVASEQGFELSEQRINITYPSIGIGAVLAEGRIEFQDGILRFDMLSFRSEDKRVFGFVHSWYLSDEQESVTRLGREIEKRIAAFDR